MKHILLCLIFVLQTSLLFATGLLCDYIYINGEKWFLMDKPLERDSTVYANLKKYLPEGRIMSTANWDGYTGHWIVIDGKIYLQKIDVDMQLSEEDQKELERLENEGNAAATEDDYVFLNVMENLVNETVDKWMQQFGTCTCSRCRADVVALSLTNLPAKYVVVGRNAAAPLMNFYSQQFSAR